jgi:hypothetical protein
MSGVQVVAWFSQLVAALSRYFPEEEARAAATRAVSSVELDPKSTLPLVPGHLRAMQSSLDADLQKLPPDRYASVRTELEALGFYR